MVVVVMAVWQVYMNGMTDGLVALSTILPEELILGLEIRMKVTEYVDLRIKNLREENPGQVEIEDFSYK